MSKTTNILEYIKKLSVKQMLELELLTDEQIKDHHLYEFYKDSENA